MPTLYPHVSPTRANATCMRSTRLVACVTGEGHNSTPRARTHHSFMHARTHNTHTTHHTRTHTARHQLMARLGITTFDAKDILKNLKRLLMTDLGGEAT